MDIELYQDVALTRDLPEHGLKIGDVATLIDFVPHPNNGEEGCVLEFFNAIGESLTVIAVPISAVEALRSDEVLSVRSLAKAA
jgi:putative heme iron utilization protein